MADSAASEPAAGRHRRGLLLGMTAAVGYSLANLALRRLSLTEDIRNDAWDLWVTSLKSLVTGLIAWTIVFGRSLRGVSAFPSVRLLVPLIGSGLLMQFGGNLCFQSALRLLGLGLTVPVVFACIIIVGAVCGRILLNDRVTRDTALSMLVMTIAILLLSAGTKDSRPQPHVLAEPGTLLAGFFLAVISGCSYGLLGVIIRRFVRQAVPAESLLIVYSTMGVVLLGGIAVPLAGWSSVLQATQDAWPALLAASTANAAAFFAMTYALRFIDVNQLNIINASQNAMCALGAVLIFQEHLTPMAQTGIVLTVIGLLLPGHHRPDQSRAGKTRVS